MRPNSWCQRKWSNIPVSAQATAADSLGLDSLTSAPLLNSAATESEAVSDATTVNPVVGLMFVAGFALILPILVIAGSMPGGLISAAIIGFGIMQAWQLTDAPKVVFEGPFKLSGGGGSERAPS